MDLVSFYQNVLCLPSPWYVERVECFADAKRVDVWMILLSGHRPLHFDSFPYHLKQHHFEKRT